MKRDLFVCFTGIMMVLVIIFSSCENTRKRHPRPEPAYHSDVTSQQASIVPVTNRGVVSPKSEGYEKVVVIELGPWEYNSASTSLFRRYKVKRFERGVVDYVLLPDTKEFAVGDTIYHLF